MSIADAEDEPQDEHVPTLPASHDLEDELTQPDEAPLVEEVVELPADDQHLEHATSEEVTGPAMADDGSSSDDLEEGDPTDRLHPIVPTEAAAGTEVEEAAEPDLFAAGDEDLLRTTARLAILADDLELRGRGEADVDTTALDQRDREEHDGRA